MPETVEPAAVLAPEKRLRAMFAPALLSSAALLATGCSVNPATGKQQIMLVSEQQEIELGQQSQAQIERQFGRLEDEGLQRYVSDIGLRLAAQSERPNLPWSFTVLDDSLVNAFALPGGFIYVTRGILTHMNSEAELVGVLGHEIGHVTARHSANQMSKAMLGQVALGVGMVAAGDYGRTVGDLGSMGLGMLFLKYGRDDERQSDSLGLRYALRTGYDGAEIPEVYEMLGRVSAAAGQSPVPNWMSTHPAPENRTQRLQQEIVGLSGELDGFVGREEFLQQIDGLAFGADPREGFFRDGVFYQPELAFEIVFPSDWPTQNSREAVFGMSPQQDSVVALSLEPVSSAAQAADSFFRESGAEPGPSWRSEINGLPTVSRGFTAYRQTQPDLRGLVAFIEYGGRVYRLLGYTSIDRFESVRDHFLETAASFRPVSDPAILDTRPQTIALIRTERDGALADQPQLRDRDIDQLELINNLDSGEVVPAGTLIKVLEGESVGTQTNQSR